MVFRVGYSNSIPGPIRVLHVDDEPTDLEITRIFLKKEAKDGFEIESVLSAEEAIEKLGSEHFDVIIADYHMPGMNGLEFLDALRKNGRYAATPFILFTGKGSQEVAKEALRRGADRYISKVGNPANQCGELACAIRELVNGKKKGKEVDYYQYIVSKLK
jgi:CheY-like chemotaxis protein